MAVLALSNVGWLSWFDGGLGSEDVRMEPQDGGWVPLAVVSRWRPGILGSLASGGGDQVISVDTQYNCTQEVDMFM